MDVLKLLRRPSAFLPITMSLLALGLVIGHISIYGIAPEHDEGAVAHAFQLLIAAQLPIILFFTMRFIHKELQNSITIIGLQMFAALMALMPVWYFSL